MRAAGYTMTQWEEAMSRRAKYFSCETQGSKAGDLPMTPQARIMLEHWEDTEKGTAIGYWMTESEIDGVIAQMKADLDAVGSHAKRALSKIKAAQKAPERG